MHPDDEPMRLDLTPMDYIRAAIANADAERMSLYDLTRAAEHAQTPQDFDAAVNMLAD